MKRLPWIHNAKKTAPEVPYEPPIPLGDKSNGEFYHVQTPYERKLRKLILERAAENATRVGMDRRDFIASTMGMATTLACVNMASGCSSDGEGSGQPSGTGRDGGGRDGGYRIPPDAMLDADAADAVFSGEEFILDLQTHHIEDEEHWREAHPDGQYIGDGLGGVLSFADCGLASRADCVKPDAYVRNIFLESDTTVAVLSGFPAVPLSDDGSEGNHPIGNIDMANSRDRVNEAAASQRMVNHCQVAPNDKWPLTAELMEKIRTERGNWGWKVYPPWAPGGGGWWMDDPAIADPFYEKCIELGEPLVCAHKGFPLPSFDPVYTDPKDVGPAAARWPGINFIIYHSAYASEAQNPGDPTIGPYDPNNLTGVNRLIKTVEDHDLKGKNVYAEMGSAWLLVMTDPISAQHYVGKCLKYIGEDHLLYGSECVWFNSPQPQIDALRTFQISQEFQDQYGYPAITDEIRAKIFGLSAAKLYGIDPRETRNAIDTNALTKLRRDLDGEFGGRRWMFRPLGGPRTRREFVQLQRWRKFLGVPA